LHVIAERGSRRRLPGSLVALDHLRDAAATIYLPGHGPAAALGGPNRDPMERLARWLLAAVPAGLGQGLRGDALKAELRRTFEAQAAAQGGIDFTSRGAEFLEDSVERAEADLAGTA
jgi:hypothetical protein